MLGGATSPVVYAAGAMILAWMFTEAVGIADNTASSEFGGHMVTAAWTGVIGMIFAAVVMGVDRVVLGAVSEGLKRAGIAAVPGVAAGAVAGFVANVVYVELLQNADFFDGFSLHSPIFYVARLVGWAIFGCGVGMVLGLVDRSSKRAVNGALGGAIGGAAGGVVFQFTSATVASVGFSRLLGLLAIGILIALATRVVETARRDAWVRVVAGGMSGKEFILYHALTRIGASPECELYLLKDPAVAKLHAHIAEQGASRVITAVHGAVVTVNGVPVASQVLRSGDQIQIGHTVLRYAERAAVPMAMPTPRGPSAPATAPGTLPSAPHGARR